MISIGKFIYNKKDILGKGGFGTVFRGENFQNGTEVAVKVIFNYHLSKYQKREIDILVGLNCRNIARLLDYFTIYGNIYVIIELCEGDMESRIQNIGRKFSEPEIRNFVRQTATGLRYIHNCDILHRDIKPANILYTHKSRKLVYKISDFGISKMIDGTERMSIRASPVYTAPEIQDYGKGNFNSDVWSLGRTVCFMITQDVYDLDNYYVSSDLEDLLEGMLDEDPDDRFEADDVLDHYFITGE